jgi:hypothetical protein
MVLCANQSHISFAILLFCAQEPSVVREKTPPSFSIFPREKRNTYPSYYDCDFVLKVWVKNPVVSLCARHVFSNVKAVWSFVSNHARPKATDFPTFFLEHLTFLFPEHLDLIPVLQQISCGSGLNNLSNL